MITCESIEFNDSCMGNWIHKNELDVHFPVYIRIHTYNENEWNWELEYYSNSENWIKYPYLSISIQLEWPPTIEWVKDNYESINDHLWEMLKGKLFSTKGTYDIQDLYKIQPTTDDSL